MEATMTHGYPHRHADALGPDFPWWRSKSGIVLLGFLAVAAFFLLTEHTAHVFGALPWLVLAACPLMHLFMHGGHGHGGRNDDADRSDKGGSP
jgi:hypothetical protein